MEDYDGEEGHRREGGGEGEGGSEDSSGEVVSGVAERTADEPQRNAGIGRSASGEEEG